MPDDFIIREGEVGNEIFFVIEGTAVVIIKPSDPIKPVIEIEKKKGEYFGEIALIIDSKRTADV